MRCDAWVGTLLWWRCQFPVAHSCGLLHHLNSFHRGMFKLNIKFDTDSLLYWPRHVECDGHTVPMLTQQRLLPPLTSTVKSSLFTHSHSSPSSLAARLHECFESHPHYINNGWTFSGQTSWIKTWEEWCRYWPCLLYNWRMGPRVFSLTSLNARLYVLLLL